MIAPNHSISKKMYEIINQKNTLLKNSIIQNDQIITYDSEKLIFYSQNLNFIKQHSIKNIELIKIIKNNFFIIYSNQNLSFYENHKLKNEINIKNVKKIFLYQDTIFVLIPKFLVQVKDFKLFKFRFDWDSIDNEKLKMKNGNVFDCENNFQEILSFIDHENEKNKLEIISPEIKDSHGCLKKMNNFKRLKENENIFKISDENEIIFNDKIIPGNFPITQIFDEYFIQKNKFRKICTHLKNNENTNENIKLLLAEDLIIFNDLILKMLFFKNSFFICDTQNFIIFKDNKIFILAVDCEIKDFDVTEKFIVFNHDEEIYVLETQDVFNKIETENNRNLELNSNNKVEKNFCSKFDTFDLNVKEKIKIKNKEKINYLILIKNYLICSSIKNIYIYDYAFEKINILKNKQNNVIFKDSNLNNNFCILIGKKIQIFEDCIFKNEIENKNNFNYLIYKKNEIIGLDVSNNLMFYDCKKKKRKYFNFNKNCEYQIEGIFIDSVSRKNNDIKLINDSENLSDNKTKNSEFNKNYLVIAGNSISTLHKKQILSKETILTELRNKQFDLNYILENKIEINIFEFKIDFDKIKKENKALYFNILRKYVNHIRYVFKIQMLIREILVEKKLFFEIELSKIENWIDSVYREFLGMKILFKNCGTKKLNY